MDFSMGGKRFIVNTKLLVLCLSLVVKRQGPEALGGVHGSLSGTESSGRLMWGPAGRKTEELRGSDLHHSFMTIKNHISHLPLAREVRGTALPGRQKSQASEDLWLQTFFSPPIILLFSLSASSLSWPQIVALGHSQCCCLLGSLGPNTQITHKAQS